MGITQVIFEREMPLPVQEMDWTDDIVGFCSPTVNGTKVMGDTEPHIIIDRQLRLVAMVWKKLNSKLYPIDFVEKIVLEVSGTVIHELIHYFSELFDYHDEDSIRMMEIIMISWMRLNEKETK